MANTQSRPKSFVQTVIPLAKTLQFYWFIGHVSSLVFFTFDFLFSFINKSKALKFYQLTLVSVIITYSIVIKQVHLKNSWNVAKLLQLQSFKDENIQYLSLSLVFLLASFKIGPVNGYYSLIVFSIFHVLHYFQKNLLPSLPISIAGQQSINSKINHFTSNYSQQALLVAANMEVFLPLALLMKSFLLVFMIFKDPSYVLVYLFTLASIVVFIKLRYNDNKYTQDVIQQWDYKISTVLNHPQLQAYPLSNLYHQNFKALVAKYIGPIRIAPKTSKKTQ